LGCPVIPASTLSRAAPTSLSTWVATAPNGGPPGLFDAASAYDASTQDQYLVVFGGSYGPGNRTNETWTLIGANWDLIPTPGLVPGAREGASMVYDPMGPYVLLFGGCCDPSTNQPYNDTWEFSGGKWTELTTTGNVTPQQDAAMTFDPLDHYVLLLGQNGTSKHSRTWTFVPGGPGTGSWNEVQPGASVPDARYYGAMAYDAADQYVLLFGGCSAIITTLSQCSSSLIPSTWNYSGGHWNRFTGTKSPAGRLGMGLTYDPTDQAVLLFGGWAGGTYLSDTWEFSGGNWTRLTPPLAPAGRELASLVFDNQTHFAVLVGGLGAGAQVNEWAWVVSPKVSVITSPDPPIDSRINVTFTGEATGGLAPYEWSWNFGDGSKRVSAKSASHNFTRSGTYYVNLTGEDSNGLLVSNTTAVTVNAHPGSYFLPKQEEADANFSEDFTSVVSNGTGTFTYNWTFGDGTNSTDPDPSHSWIAPNQYLINLTVTDKFGEVSKSSANYTVNPDPVVVYFGANVTAPQVGVPFTILTLVRGGWGNSSYGYPGSDPVPGCVVDKTNRSPVIPCLVYTPGTYRWHLQMHDEEYKIARANYTLVVSPVPTSTNPNGTFLRLSDNVVLLLVGLLVVLEVILLAVAYVTWGPSKKRPPTATGPAAPSRSASSGPPRPPQGAVRNGQSGAPGPGPPVKGANPQQGAPPRSPQNPSK